VSSFWGSLQASLETNIPGFVTGKLQLNPNIAKKLTEEQKLEIIQHGQPVVDARQMREMSEVIDMLEEEFFIDRQKRYYITIDRLDERWVIDDLRYRLIRALLETVRDLNNKLSAVKVIVAIREDLLSRMFRRTRDRGDQEEKYKSLYLRLSWNSSDLETILDNRVNQLIKDQYTKSPIKVRDLLPDKISKQYPIRYMVDRTLNMPRDIIMLFNECLRAAEGQAIITERSLSKAEGVYSDIRLRALADEWSADYPNLIPIVFFLKKQKKEFKLKDVNVGQFEDFMLRFLINDFKTQDCYIYKLVEEKLGQTDDLFRGLARIFYRVGILGIKRESYLPVEWSFLGDRIVEVELRDDVTYFIHPAFWRVLGINPSGE
jgi:hypothetical protein